MDCDRLPNGTYMLHHSSGCGWTFSESYYDGCPCSGSFYISLTLDDGIGCVTGGVCSDRRFFFGYGQSNNDGEGVAANNTDCQDDGGYGGTATWKPVWNCEDCPDESCTDLNVIAPDDTEVQFANTDCSPRAGSGTSTEVTIRCDDAVYVIPEVSVTGSSEVVKVTYTPGCRPGTSAMFKIEGLSGSCDKRATVECTATFYDGQGQRDSDSVIIDVKPSCTACCDCDCPPEV